MAELTRVTGSAPFRPKARLLRLLGDELISDEVMAVVELVKNSYDADAHQVTVAFCDLDLPSSARIEVIDDGDGMDLETVLNTWLEPATDRKRRSGRKARTALGRYPLGEKGVGRFAAAKLGSRISLISRARGGSTEVSLHVHWDLFGDGHYLDEIDNTWEMGKPEVFTGDGHGTLLRIRELTTEWDPDRLERLRDGLARLVSPFSQVHDFRIVLECPKYPELSGVISSPLLGRAPYRLIGRVDSTGALIDEERPDGPVDLRQFAPEHFREADGLRPPTCGPFRVALYVWDLDSVGLKRAAVDRGMRTALRRMSGVSIYRDGFRVWPYGAPGDDWLELNQRRVNNPTLRISTNQVVGMVEITQEANPGLRDRTSREGLIDSPALRDLKALVLGAIARLEERRFAERQARLVPQPSAEESDPILRMLGQVRARIQGGEATRQLLQAIASSYRRQLSEYQERQDRLLRLAAAGLAAEQIGREIDRTIAAASTALGIARNLADRGLVPDEARRAILHLDSYVTLLGEQLDAMEPLVNGNVSAPDDPVDLRSVVQHAATVYAFHFQQPGSVHLTIEAPSPVSAHISRSHLLQVLLHLFDNSLHWLKRVPDTRKPRIHVRLTGNPPRIVFADNGPGVRPEAREHIFSPFFSGRSDGRGLGLHLVRTILGGYGYSIRLLDVPLLLPGANFEITLDRSSSSR